MKIWMLFLLGSFIAGGVSLRRSKPERPMLFLVVCIVVAAATYSGRFS